MMAPTNVQEYGSYENYAVNKEEDEKEEEEEEEMLLDTPPSSSAPGSGDADRDRDRDGHGDGAVDSLNPPIANTDSSEDGLKWGGLILHHDSDTEGSGSSSVPLCKHLLACVLAERWVVAGSMVGEREVGREEMGGWGGGWGG